MFKKTIASVVVMTQMSLSFVAIGNATADDTQTAVMTPELTLVQNTVAIIGEKLSTQERQIELAQAVSDYNKTAQADGQLDRMEQALVTLKIYEPAQAHQLTEQAQSYASSSAPKTQDAVANEIALLASQNPAGAQFAGCTLGQVELGAGGVAAFMGFVVWLSGSSSGGDALCDAGGNDCIPNPSWQHAGEIVAGIGAVAMVVGALTWGLGASKCDQ